MTSLASRPSIFIRGLFPAPIAGNRLLPLWIAVLLLQVVLLVLSPLAVCAASADARPELEFRRIQLSDVFYTEAAAFGDIDGDGVVDAVAGPFWYAGPDFAARHEIYAPVPFDPLQYSDNFAVAVQDVNGDGHNDVLVVGFPGRDAWWFENPAAPEAAAWPRHVILSGVDNESAGFHDVDGDGRLELVCMHAQQLGFARSDPSAPSRLWRFQSIAQGEWATYTHGLGVGDVDADGRMDVLELNGWWRQPDAAAIDQGAWVHNAFRFGGGRGGAQMLVYDITGDARPDVITSIDAHGFGLSWFEQMPSDAGGAAFREHVILPAHQPNRHGGRQFSQLHALVLADVDGDGLQDVATGKRWWAHGPTGDPEPNAPAVLYAFLLRREADGAVRFEPHRIDDASGVGTQFDAQDVNGDGRADFVTANKKGAFVFLSVSDVSGR